MESVASILSSTIEQARRNHRKSIDPSNPTILGSLHCQTAIQKVTQPAEQSVSKQ